jgi:hypothetical protein
LLYDKLGRYGINADDTLWILGGEAGNDGRSVYAERGKRLEVRLDAGAAAAVGSGDGERTIEF